MEPSINLQGVILVSMVPQLTGNKSTSLQSPQNQQMKRRKWKEMKEGRKRGFSGGLAVKNPCANARNTGSIPGPGRSPCQGATKPVHHNYCAWGPNYWSLSALDSNAVDRTDESLSATTMTGPCSPATRELNKAHAQQKDPTWPKINKWIFF